MSCQCTSIKVDEVESGEHKRFSEIPPCKTSCEEGGDKALQGSGITKSARASQGGDFEALSSDALEILVDFRNSCTERRRCKVEKIAGRDIYSFSGYAKSTLEMEMFALQQLIQELEGQIQAMDREQHVLHKLKKCLHEFRKSFHPDYDSSTFATLVEQLYSASSAVECHMSKDRDFPVDYADDIRCYLNELQIFVAAESSERLRAMSAVEQEAADIKASNNDKTDADAPSGDDSSTPTDASATCPFKANRASDEARTTQHPPALVHLQRGG